MLFEQTHKDAHCRARTGIIHTDHGDITTPMFMPVGTKATVKSLDTRDIDELGAEVILNNTYHLNLRPGADIIDAFGGSHKFMNWDKPILTDSGGFQVFSLGAQKDAKDDAKNPLVKIDEDGVDFRSHIDGSKHLFTPESAIQVQHKLGADIIMAFDECTPDNATAAYATQAMNRTHRWLDRCIAEHKKNTQHHGYRQFLFGIIQGGTHEALRKASAQYICNSDVDGIAIGGESIGYNMNATKDILSWIADILPVEKAHYTMGVGFSPYDFFDVVEWGIDIFDCVAPTRMARNGALYVHPKTFGEFKKLGVQAKNPRRVWVDATMSAFKDDHRPLDPRLPHSPIAKYSRAYLYHLFKENELLGYRLATMHNLWYMIDVCKHIQQAIQEDRFLDLKKQWYAFL